MKQLASGEYSAAFIFGHEGNHTDDHRRGREGHNEVDSDSSGSRLEEILGDKGNSKKFDLDDWKSRGSNGKALEDGQDLLNGDYAGMDIERIGGDRGMQGNENKLKSCQLLFSTACAADVMINLYNIGQDLKEDGIQSKKDIAKAKSEEPGCGKECKAKYAKEQAELDALFTKTKEGYIGGMTPAEVAKSNQNNVADLINAINDTPGSTTLGSIDRFKLLDEYYNKSPEFKDQVDAMLPYVRTKADAMNMAFANLGVEDAKEAQKNIGYLSTAANFIPTYGAVKMGVEALSGKDLFSGREFSPEERVLIGLGLGKGILELGSLLPKPKEITKPSSTSQETIAVTPNGQTVKIKVDADDLGTPINKTSSNSGGNINNLKPQDVNLSDFTQKGGKIDNFAEGVKGKSYNELEALFDKELVGNLGYTKKPLAIGGEDKGFRYLLPNGKSVFLEKGWGNFEDPLHNGAYVKIPGYNKSSLSDSNGVIRIPLEGNPTLK